MTTNYLIGSVMYFLDNENTQYINKKYWQEFYNPSIEGKATNIKNKLVGCFDSYCGLQSQSTISFKDKNVMDVQVSKELAYLISQFFSGDYKIYHQTKEGFFVSKELFKFVKNCF